MFLTALFLFTYFLSAGNQVNGKYFGSNEDSGTEEIHGDIDYYKDYDDLFEHGHIKNHGDEKSVEDDKHHEEDKHHEDHGFNKNHEHHKDPRDHGDNKKRKDNRKSGDYELSELKVPRTDENCSLCGISGFSGQTEVLSKIINGVEVRPFNKYPWIVPIMKNHSYAFKCGGAIISRNFVLTAGHCVINKSNPDCNNPGSNKSCLMSPEILKVGIMFEPLGSENLNRKEVGVSNIIIHPEFDLKLLINDIALLELQDGLNCSKYTRPICYPRTPLSKMEQSVIIAVWDLLAFDQVSAGTELREGRVKQVDPILCQNHTSKEKSVEKIFCTTGTWNQTSCYGDSGSSAVGDFEGVYYTLGITSGGSKACSSNDPVNFVNTYGYRDFVESHVHDLPVPPPPSSSLREIREEEKERERGKEEEKHKSEKEREKEKEEERKGKQREEEKEREREEEKEREREREKEKERERGKEKEGEREEETGREEWKEEGEEDREREEGKEEKKESSSSSSSTSRIWEEK